MTHTQLIHTCFCYAHTRLTGQLALASVLFTLYSFAHQLRFCRGGFSVHKAVLRVWGSHPTQAVPVPVRTLTLRSLTHPPLTLVRNNPCAHAPTHAPTSPLTAHSCAHPKSFGAVTRTHAHTHTDTEAVCMHHSFESIRIVQSNLY